MLSIRDGSGRVPVCFCIWGRCMTYLTNLIVKPSKFQCNGCQSSGSFSFVLLKVSVYLNIKSEAIINLFKLHNNLSVKCTYIYLYIS